MTKKQTFTRSSLMVAALAVGLSACTIAPARMGPPPGYVVMAPPPRVIIATPPPAVVIEPGWRDNGYRRRHWRD